MTVLSGDAVTDVPTSDVARERGRGRGEIGRELVGSRGVVGNEEIGEAGAGGVVLEEHVMV